MSKGYKQRFPQNDEILKILYRQNPWWQKKPIPANRLKDFKRDGYFKLIEKIHDPQILGMFGPRQVGKTTILYQLIKELQKDVNEKNIFFLSLDDPHLLMNQENFVRIIELYSTSVIKCPLDELKDKVYMIFDEVQALKNWQMNLKRWIDLGYEIKFIIACASADILKNSYELAGRISPQAVLPMKFFEYVRYYNRNDAELLIQSRDMMRKGLMNSIRKTNAALFHNAVTCCADNLAPIKGRMMSYLDRYLIQGGYPGIMALDEIHAKAERLEDHRHLAIYKDVIFTGKIRDTALLEKMFATVSKESPKIINLQNITKNLGISRNTLITYLSLLERASLISYANAYSENKTPIVKAKKMYVNDVGIRNVTSRVFNDETFADHAELGKIVETVVADHSRRLKTTLDPCSRAQLYYWRGPFKASIVMELYGKVLPIEIKYRQNITGADYKRIRNFDGRFGKSLSLIITRDYLDKREGIVFVPSWLYLLMC